MSGRTFTDVIINNYGSLPSGKVYIRLLAQECIRAAELSCVPVSNGGSGTFALVLYMVVIFCPV